MKRLMEEIAHAACPARRQEKPGTTYKKGQTKMTNTKKEIDTIAESAESPTVPVLTRFTREELDTMQEETGANADATAVACFVRKNLRKRA